MPADRRDAPPRLQRLLKPAVLGLMVIGVGLPLNELFSYLLLLLAAIVLATGRVTARRRAWAVAVAVVVAAIAGKWIADVPRIEEGHNVFLPGPPDSALANGLPPDVYRAMADEFDRVYPAATRCAGEKEGCWQSSALPKRAYAFSFDGLYDSPAYSRRVTGIDFSNAIWHRLGFVNELAYNWYGGDIVRGQRPRGVSALWNQWRITIPYFVMYQFPAAFAGSRLCWRGTVLWEEAGGHFTRQHHAAPACRTIASSDAGRRIFGLAIAQQPALAMQLRPTPAIRLLQLVQPALALIVVAGLLLLLVRWERRRLVFPVAVVGLSMVAILANDASFVGGVRPFDGGNDGLVFDGWARIMVQHLWAGDVLRALEGLEPVFYFTPGARYLRAAEHLIFGESYLGYVSLLLLLPFLVFSLSRRFLNNRWALALTLVFIALPVGALFGSTFYLYVKHASQGYGDPAAAVLFLAGLTVLIGRTRRGPNARFAPAFGAGLLFALALFVRPNFALGAAVLLGGAGLAALWQGQIRRLAGMCIGFLPVFGMALHNWYFGGEYVLFSRHTTFDLAMPAPPGAYLAALGELVRLDFGGVHLAQCAFQIVRMLTGPSESFAMVPVNAAAIAVTVWVLLSRRHDGWLRLTAGAALGLHIPALFFIYSGRYHLVAWLITGTVCMVWLRQEAIPWIERRYPEFTKSFGRQPGNAWLARRLEAFARASGLLPRDKARATSGS